MLLKSVFSSYGKFDPDGCTLEPAGRRSPKLKGRKLDLVDAKDKKAVQERRLDKVGPGLSPKKDKKAEDESSSRCASPAMKMLFSSVVFGTQPELPNKKAATEPVPESMAAEYQVAGEHLTVDKQPKKSQPASWQASATQSAPTATEALAREGEEPNQEAVPLFANKQPEQSQLEVQGLQTFATESSLTSATALTGESQQAVNVMEVASALLMLLNSEFFEETDSDELESDNEVKADRDRQVVADDNVEVVV